MEFVADDGDGDEDCFPISFTEFGGNPGSRGFRHQRCVIVAQAEPQGDEAVFFFPQLLQYCGWREPRSLHPTGSMPMSRTNILNPVCLRTDIFPFGVKCIIAL